MAVVIKSSRELELMRRAGRSTAVVLKKLSESVKPGMKTSQLDEIANEEARMLGGRPTFKGYQGFPASLCVSINNEIVHGIPGERVIQEGDIVSLDFGLEIDGFQGDTAVTVAVGAVSPEVTRLIDVTRDSLQAGIDAARHGNRIGDVSAAIQEYVETRGFSVIREYTGHGIGRDMHEDPQIPNFGRAGTGLVLKKGMTIAIEPMVTNGRWLTRVGNDRWVVYTADGSLAAHFEHTIAICDGQAEILTAV
ncbi:MAG: type I methionyl aminopeptidase [Dehalococcoidales bacterium]|nr:type I methionyl aminopeptidase [Dehalococcoidales bacterium]MDD3264484.1 type I methionyl aminopeptidase [Dehalococcoidales bacterium]MDD4322015.1 type I methionyl aminopeptidase [Dehalococcoidales bacterium]MDD4793892.1 type I methionyl aminopeptidase [Dehalococcoidales bacterium]MDD5498024.1 type I methionyl aminopeptidase [Dehalococcoidales bacterium]